MTLSNEQKRQVASLSRNSGYKLLCDIVVDEFLESANVALDAARTRDTIYEYAILTRAWRRVKMELERVPRELEDELKQQGDEVYG